MQAPRIQNETDFLAEPRMLLGRDGERMVVIVKATFERLVGARDADLELAPQQRGLRSADIPWGEPEKSSIRYPSDLCIAKPGTDVVVVAAAHAPGGKPVGSFDAGVRVGKLTKSVRVFGPRVWVGDGSALTAPRPTDRVEVRYDNAWGGFDDTGDEPLEEPRNPVGRGVVRDLSKLTHAPAPSIEDPAALISSVRTRPAPAGLGAIGRHWEPRRPFHGTYDSAWLTERAPLLPLDHDDRANLCATPGLTATPPLSGGEDVALVNLTPGGGSRSFKLPSLRVSVALEAAGKPVEARTPYLDTIVIDTLDVKEPAEVVVELVWRAAFVPPRRLKNAAFVVREAGA